ncbi:pentapeptide repeat-containing protein [Streptomyces sp. NPDC001663]|uniref:pentapeptide repeat-containing protein n=1 Tax=Streptomyces sp. NPDC001663 TaxID=3364597 RepID=UPI0036A57FDE
MGRPAFHSSAPARSGCGTGRAGPLVVGRQRVGTAADRGVRAASTGPSPRGAAPGQVRLTGANLTGTNLSFADLTGAAPAGTPGHR